MNYSRLLLQLTTLFSLNANAQAPTDTLRLDEAVVTGTRNATDVRHLTQSITSIGRTTLTAQHRESVIPTIVQQTPGLFATSRGTMGYGVSTGAAGTMKVRGIGGGAELLVLIDGQPQYAGLMGHPIADAYQTMMAEKVEVLRGPASMYYGSNAMAGVVNIVTRTPVKDGSLTHVNVAGGSYASLETSATNQLHYGNFTSTIGAQYRRTDGHTDNADYDQAGGFANVAYAFSSHWTAKGDANITHFNFSNPGGDELPMVDYRGKITRGLASLSVTNDYQRSNGVLRAFYDWGHHNINDGYCPTLPDNLGAIGLGRLSSIKKPKTDLYLHNDYIAGITTYQSTALFSGNRTTVGLDWQHFGGSAWNEPIGGGDKTYLQSRDGEKQDHITQDEVGLYVDFRQDLFSFLSLDAGLRYDWHTRSHSQWIPQGGLSFRITKRDQLKASVSKGFRNATISEMFMFNANADLRPEVTVSYELAYAHRFSHGRIGANVFHIDGHDAITLVMGQSYQNTGDISNTGFEVEGAWNVDSHFSIDGNYSFLHMEHVATGAPRHKLYVGAHYEAKGFKASVGVQHIGGLTLLTADQATNADADIEETFTLLDATLSYTLRLGGDFRTTFYVRGDNLLNQHYATYCFVNRFYNFGKVGMPGANVMGGVSLSF